MSISLKLSILIVKVTVDGKRRKDLDRRFKPCVGRIACNVFVEIDNTIYKIRGVGRYWSEVKDKYEYNLVTTADSDKVRILYSI